VELPAASSVTFRVTTVVSAPAGATIRNSARVSPPPGVEDVNPGNDSGTCVTRVREETPPTDLDLAVTVSNGVPSVVPGTGVTYLATVTNAGPATATAAPVSITVPGLSGLAWSCLAAGAPGSSCAAAGSGAVSDAATLPAGGAVTYTLTGTVDPCALGELVASASVAPPPGALDLNLANNQAEDRDPLTPIADLAVTKTLLSAAESAVFAVEVVNLGPSCASGVELADPLPAGAVLESVSLPCVGGFPCSLGTLAPSDPPRSLELSLGLPIDCSGQGTLTNLATVSASTPDPSLSNNSSSATAPLPRVDLAITKSDGQAQTVAGSPLAYTVTVANLGTVPTEGLVEDELPAALQGTSWTCAPSAGSSCPGAGTGDLEAEVLVAPGGEATFTVSGTLASSFLGTLTNTARVALADGGSDCQVTNDEATDTTEVLPAGPVVLKEVLGGLFENQEGVYEILIVNGGNAPLPDGVGDELTDIFPLGVTPLSATATSGVASLAGQVLTWNGSIPAGGSVLITVTVLVEPGTLGQVLCNRAVLTTPDDTVLSDDPLTPGLPDETCRQVTTVELIPALSAWALVALALLLAVVALRRLRG
jgi:uncharacterized repeat protein (TIGR01451 family)